MCATDIYNAVAVALKESDFQKLMTSWEKDNERYDEKSMDDAHANSAHYTLEFISKAKSNYIATKRYHGKKKKFRVLVWDGTRFWLSYYSWIANYILRLYTFSNQFQYIIMNPTGCEYYMMRGELNILRYKGNKLILPKEEK